MCRKWIAALKNIFFPLLCLECGKKIKKDYLCYTCQGQIKKLMPPACYTAISLHQNDNFPKPASGEKIKITSTYKYQGPIKKVIHCFKYKRLDYLAQSLGRMMLEQLKELKFTPSGYDLLTPVPLHPYKIKSRGYNQSELLAKQLANYFKIPLKNDIMRSDYIKKSQTELDPLSRRKNTKGKFTAKENLKDQNIILIDDVLTTGSTLSACAAALRRSGAGQIEAITLAK